MLRSLWIRKLFGISSARSNRRQRKALTRRTVSLQLETLEERVTPTVTVVTATDTASLQGYIADANNGNSSDQYVINLKANTTFNLDATQEIGNGSNTSPNVTIKGLGGDTITPVTGVRAFQVDAGAEFEFENLTISGGKITASTTPSTGGIGVGGAAIFVGGDVTLDHVVVSDNTAYAADGVNNACGGGIFVISSGNLTIQDGSEITGNKVLGTEIGGTSQGATAVGGGIYANGGSSININISDSTLSGNIAQGGDSAASASKGGSGDGAALYSRGGAALQLTNVTVEGNHSYGGNNTGGGAGGSAVGALVIENIHNNISLVNVEVSNNQAIGGNGATEGGNAEAGGLLLAPGYASTAITILNSSFYSNEVQGGNGTTGGNAAGGAIFATDFKGGSTFNMFNSTVAQNTVQGGSPSSSSSGATAVGGGLAFPVSDPITPLLYNDTIVFNQVTGNLPSTLTSGQSTNGAAISGNSREDNVLAQGNYSNGFEDNQLVRGAKNVNTVSNLQVSNSPTTIYVNGVGLTVYPLLPGAALAIGTGTTDTLPAIAAAEGVSQSDATDEAGKPRTAAAGTVDISACQFNPEVTGFVNFNAPSSLNITYGTTQTTPFSLQFQYTATGLPVSGGTVYYSVVDANGTLVPAVSAQVDAEGNVTINAITLPTTPLPVSTNKYFIELVYYQNSAPFDSTTIPLDIAQAATTTSVTSSPSVAAVSSSPRTLTVTANVTASGVAVNEGQVTFQLIDSDGITILDTSSPANVIAGVATSTLTVPTNQKNGVYTIVAGYDDTSPLPANFTNSTNQTPFIIGVTSATLVNTTPPGASFPYGQNLALPVSAQIYSGVAQTPVTEGTVTFTLYNSAGVSVASLVDADLTDGAGGTLTTTSALPAGAYQLVVSYDDSGNSNNFTAPPTPAQTVTITAAATSTTVTPLSPIAFSSSDQNVTGLSATVMSNGIPVSTGTVTFTLYNSNNVQVGNSVSGTYSGGVWTPATPLVVPGGTAAGSYHVVATYSDGTNPDFTNSQGSQALDILSTTATLGISPATTTITVSTSNQNVPVTVTLKDANGNPISGGTVSFTLTDANGNAVSGFTPLSPVNVVNGTTGAVQLSIPGNTGAGSYTITATYTPAVGGVPYITVPVTSTLVINAASTSVSASVSPATIPASNSTAQTLNVSATITSGGSPVSEGTVTFTLVGSGGQVGVPSSAITVDSLTGKASTTLTVPAGTAAGSYQVVASYSDANKVFASNSGTGQLAITSGVGTLTLNPVTPITGSTSNQNVSVSAVVLGPTGGGPVNTGTVTFTLTPTAGGTPIASGTTTPSGGSASTMLSIPGGTAAGSYVLTASYTGGSFTPPNATQTLTINAADTSTTLTSTPSIPFSAANSGSIQVSATVQTTGGGGVPNGHLTFTLYDSSNAQVGQSVTVIVTNDTTPIGTLLTVPPGTPVGNYHITASFADDVNHVFANSSSTEAFTILSTSATLSLGSVTPITASPMSQIVPVTATLKDANGNPISGGTVTFALTDSHGNAVAGFVAPPPASVTAGTTGAVMLILPAQTRAGSYTITATYSAGGFPYVVVPATTTLTVNAAPTMIVVNSVSPITANASGQPATVTATVTSNDNPVAQGAVTFTLVGSGGQIGQSVTVAVNAGNNGVVTATLTVPGGTAAASYGVRASYHDNQGVYADSNSGSNSSGGIQLIVNNSPTPQTPLLSLYLDAAELVLNLNGYGLLLHLPSAADLLANIQYNLSYAGIWGLPVLVAGLNAGQQLVDSATDS